MKKRTIRSITTTKAHPRIAPSRLNDPASYNFADAIDEWTARLDGAKAASTLNQECYLVPKAVLDKYLTFARGLTAAARELDAIDSVNG